MPLEGQIESKKLVVPYLWTITCAGGLIHFLAAYRLDLKIVDLKLGVLVIITGLLSSRMTFFQVCQMGVPAFKAPPIATIPKLRNLDRSWSRIAEAPLDRRPQ